MAQVRRAPEVSIGMVRQPSGDKKIEHFNQVWKKISDAAEKELGFVPRELVARWEFHTGRKAPDIDEEDENVEEEENGSDVSDEDEDELDEEYEDRKEPKSVEELKIRAFHLSEKKNRKKTLIQERNLQHEAEHVLASGERLLNVRDSNWYSSTQNTRKRIVNTGLWRIQAEFGSTVVSFFDFLRWTVLLNIFNSVIVLMLVIVPQLVENQDDLAPLFSNETCNYFQTDVSSVNWYPQINISKCCSIVYNLELREKQFEFDETNFFPSLSDLLGNLLQGTNFMEFSPMFYGYYDGTFVFDIKGVKFDFPLAFLLVMMTIMIVNLVVIVVSSAKSFYKSIEENIDHKVPIASIIFGAWDFGLTEKEGIEIKKKEIRTSLKVVLASGSSVPTNRKTWVIRFFVNLFVFAILAGFLYLIYYVSTEGLTRLQNDYNCTQTEKQSENECFVIEYVPSITVTVGNILIPFIFTMLIGLENYSNKNAELFFNLSRCIALRLASLMVALLSLQTTVNCDYARKDFIADGVECDPTLTNCSTYQVCSNAGIDDFCAKPICWETYVGQQFYKLTIVDFLAQVGLVFLVDFPRSLLFGKVLEGNKNFESLHKFAGRIEFNVSKHVLDIVYTQAICWLALFYAPLISIVTVIKCLLIYGLRIFFVLYVCVPAEIAFSASRATAFFKGFLLLSFGLTLTCVCLLVGVVKPSTACGAFRNVVIGAEGNNYVYDYIVNTIEGSEIDTLNEILFFLGKTSVLYSIAGVLALLTYFMWAYSSADGALLQQMRKQLKTLKTDNVEKYRSLRNDIRLNFQ